VVEERARFVLEYESGEFNLAELCRHYGIARKTGYKWVERFAEDKLAGLQDLRRAPRRHPNQTPREMEEQVLELRQAHMRWGPRKLRRYLQERRPGRVWPAASTIGELLQREGLVTPRKRRRRTPPYTQPFAAADGPNRVWCADFKGWFRTQDGERIDPLTITDAHSRYLLRCQAVEKTDTARVQAIFEAAFRECGMPQAIRTDNGAPFASRAIAGVSRLAVWLMKLEIVPERIQAGHPEQNGRHERMHRTLKEETATPPTANRRAQQRAFDRFRQEYNEERPHEALHQRTPGAVYVASPRAYPERLAEPEYDSGLEVRRVYPHGQFFWQGHDVFLTKALAGERIGLEPVEEDYWCVYFAGFPLALFDSEALHLEPLPASEDEIGGWKSGNPKTGDSQIPTAATATTTTFSREDEAPNTGANVLPMCPV
jgi:transposase InsO family protein